MFYKVGWFEIKNGIVEIPEGAIPLKTGLMLTKPFRDPDTKMVDGICCLIPIEEDK